MRVTEAIKQAKGSPLFTFEILPPEKGMDIQSIYDTIDPLIEFGPKFIEVTYHREEVEFRERNDGSIQRKVLRKRPGTVGISAAIKFKYGVEVIPHIICGGFTVDETENGLIDLHFLGIKNLLAIRGDNLPGEKLFRATKGGHQYTADLIRQVMNLNSGIYQDEELKNTSPTDFTVGIAGYPEKHAESPNLQADIKYLKEKVDAGASYIVTQMFFDNKMYFDFVDRCRNAGIKAPIIPGIKPISTRNQLLTLPKTFNISIPEELQLEVEKCNNNAEVRQLGVEWAIHQSKELISGGAPVLHYFTMGKSDNIQKIASEVF
ncbi:MAG: methylenetetrahydrofolate reductase [Bacteroidota bacterium]